MPRLHYLKTVHDLGNLTLAGLFEVRPTVKSKIKQLALTPGDEAYRQLADGHCPLVKA
jgi:hypothetical protein